MLQRIQSIFLLGAMASGLSLLIDPMNLASVQGDVTLLKSQPESMLDDGVFHTSDHILLIILVGLTALLSLVSIFQFKNRNRQLTLVRLTMISFLLLLLLAGFFFYQDYSQLNAGSLFDVGIGALAPVVGILFSILAIRAIRKDEKLIRSMDRLR